MNFNKYISLAFSNLLTSTSAHDLCIAAEKLFLWKNLIKKRDFYSPPYFEKHDQTKLYDDIPFMMRIGKDQSKAVSYCITATPIPKLQMNKYKQGKASDLIKRQLIIYQYLLLEEYEVFCINCYRINHAPDLISASDIDAYSRMPVKKRLDECWKKYSIPPIGEASVSKYQELSDIRNEFAHKNDADCKFSIGDCCQFSVDCHILARELGMALLDDDAIKYIFPFEKATKKTVN